MTTMHSTSKIEKVQEIYLYRASFKTKQINIRDYTLNVMCALIGHPHCNTNHSSVKTLSMTITIILTRLFSASPSQDFTRITLSINYHENQKLMCQIKKDNLDKFPAQIMKMKFVKNVGTSACEILGETICHRFIESPFFFNKINANVYTEFL